MPHAASPPDAVPTASAQVPPSQVPPDPLVQPLVDQIVAEFDPLRVILFGSRATGDARPDSDVDLLVVMPDGTDRRRKMVDIGVRLPREVSIDLLVTTPSLLAVQVNNRGLIYREIVQTGRDLYIRDHADAAE